MADTSPQLASACPDAAARPPAPSAPPPGPAALPPCERKLAFCGHMCPQYKLCSITIGLGSELKWQHFTAFIRQPKALIFGLIAQLLLLPVISILLIYLFNIPSPYSIGILLLALSPGGSSSNAFTHIVGGNVALSVSMTAISGIITVFTMPFILMFYMNTQQMIHLPIGNILIQNIIIMLLPLFLGMLTLHYKPI